MTGQNVVLSKDDVDLVKNLMTRRHPTLSESELYAVCIIFFNFYSMYILYQPFSKQTMLLMILGNRPLENIVGKVENAGY